MTWEPWSLRSNAREQPIGLEKSASRQLGSG
jgi:hypothetical protein